MKRSCLALLAVLGLVPAFAWSQTEVLRLVPEEALVFGVVNRLGAADQNLVALGRRLQLPAQSLLKLGQDFLGTDKGLDAQGRLLAVLLLGEAGPEVVIALPVTDYAQFLQPCKPRDRGDGVSEIDRGFLGSFLVAKKGSFALLAHGDHGGALKKVRAASGKVAAQTKPLSSWLDQQDLAVVIPQKGLQTGGDLVRQKLDEIEGMVKAFAQPEDAKAAALVMSGLGRFLKTAQEEVTQAGLGIRLDAAGNFHLASQALFSKEGQLARAGASFEKLTADPLAGLTGPPFVLAMGGAVTEATMQALMDFSMLAAKETYKDLTPDQVRTMEEIYRKTMGGVQGMAFILGLPQADAPMFSSAMAVYKVKNAAQYLQEYEKAMEQMSVIEKEAKIPGLAAKVKKAKVGNRPALEMVTDLEKALAAQQKGKELDPLAKRMMEVLFGPGKELHFTMVAADAGTILVGFLPAAKMADQLAAIRQARPLAQAPEVAKTIALLPKQAQWLGLLNPKGGRDLIASLAAVFAPEGANVQIPPFPATPPLGFAAKLTRQGLEGHLVIPSQVQEGIGAIIQGLKRDQ